MNLFIKSLGKVFVLGLFLFIFSILMPINKTEAATYFTAGGSGGSCRMSGYVSLNATNYSPGDQVIVNLTSLSFAPSGCSSLGGGNSTTVFATDNGGYGGYYLTPNSPGYFTATAGGGTIWVNPSVNGNNGAPVALQYYMGGGCGGSCGTDVDVWVTPIASPNTAIDQMIYGSGAINVHWLASNGTTSCTLVADDVFLINGGVTGVKTQNPPTSDVVYKAICSNGSDIYYGVKNFKVTPAVTVTANPKTILPGATSNISWTSQGANSCDSGGHGTSTLGGFPVTPPITTDYPVFCSESSTIIPGYCTGGTYTVNTPYCSGTVGGSSCNGVMPGPAEGLDCYNFEQYECPGSVEPWCHHGCHWNYSGSSTSGQCEEFGTQAGCQSQSTCTWHPAQTVAGDMGSDMDTVTVGPAPLDVTLTAYDNFSYSISSGEKFHFVASAVYGEGATCHITGALDTGYSSNYTDDGTDHAFWTAALSAQDDPYNYKVTCTKAGISDEDNKDISVTGPSPLPDLTAGMVTPTTATPGQTYTFYSTITNGGSTSTGVAFPNLFQTAIGFDDGYAPMGVVDWPVSQYMYAIGPGNNSVASKSITLPVNARFIRACADKSSSNGGGVVTESNEGNNCSPAWTQLVPLPDLIAYPATTSPASGITTSTNVTLSAVIKNIGQVSTGASFYNFFQVTATEPSGGNTAVNSHKKSNLLSSLIKVAEAGGAGTCYSTQVTDLDEVLMSTLGAGASGTTSKTYTFPEEGMYWIRACADKTSSSGGGVITESSENNNCGVWVPVTVGATPIPGQCNCTHYNCAVGTSINNVSGQSAWTWNCQGLNGGVTSELCSEAKPPTGNLVPATYSCEIDDGRDKCKINFSWTTTGAFPNTGVINSSNVPVGTGTSSLGTDFDVKYNTETFRLGTSDTPPATPVLLDTETVFSHCRFGSTWNALSHVCEAQAAGIDLTAGPINQTVVPVGQPIDFHVRIINQGTNPTLTSFSNLFQLANDDIGTGASVLSVVTAPALAGNSFEDIFTNHTFATQGEKYMRACADNDDKMNGTINEGLNEGNNCGPWTLITVVPNTSIDGQCALSHYQCTIGSSVLGSNTATLYKWSCVGYFGGTTDSCSECINGASNPPTCTIILPPSCNWNGSQDNGETGVDCGGGGCPACVPVGGGSCSDGILNNEEIKIDCGGPNCPACVKKPWWKEL